MATILIVDDSAFARTRLSRLFEQGGHEVVACASQGEDAIVEYHRHRPDIVTMDYVMEDMTGDTAMKEIIALDPDAKIIMISGADSSNLKQRVLDAGARAYVEKFNLDVDLLKVIDQVAAR